MNSYKKIIAGVFCTFAVLAISGCSLDGSPRPRLGYLPIATMGVPFPDPNNLGKHSYGLSFSENGGIIYTCKGGHLDLDHIRGSADNTRYIDKKIRSTLSKNAKGFSFSLAGDPSSHKITFTYPPNWNLQPQKDRIIEEIALNTAPQIAFDVTTWHEILTWFGVHFMILEPEFNSAFSWEDIYSNLLGTWLAVDALKDTEHNFNDAMTIGLQRKLKELQIQPKAVAIAASDKVRNKWYTGSFISDTKMRNFDIGLDGFVTPTLVEGMDGCNGQPLSLPAPTLDVLKRHGFTMTHQVKPNVLQQGRIFKAAGSKKIFPEKHFPIIIEYMKKQADEKGYQYDE